MVDIGLVDVQPAHRLRPRAVHDPRPEGVGWGEGGRRQLEAPVGEGFADGLSAHWGHLPIFETFLVEEARQRLPIDVNELSLQVVHVAVEVLGLLQEGDDLIGGAPGPPCTR